MAGRIVMTRPLGLLLLVLLLGLGACAKKGLPEPPGPKEDITYPKIYPTR